MNRKQRCLLIGVLISVHLSYGQADRYSYVGLGAYSHTHTDVFSLLANPAALAQLESTAAAIYTQRMYMLNELSSYQSVAGIQTSAGNFGLAMQYYGYSQFRKTEIGIAHARKAGKNMAVGLRFNYTGIGIAGYGSASAISAEAGVVFHLTSQVHAGIHINNPVGVQFGKEHQEKLPSVYSMGIGYEPSSRFFISATIIKEEDQPPTVNAGFQYNFISSVFIRAGISTATAAVWAGVGLLYKRIRIDVTTSYHPQLGITPGLALAFYCKAVTPTTEGEQE
jgi:hypothetical protein